MTYKELIKEEIEKQKSFYQRTFDVLHPDDLDATIAYAHIELLDRLLQFIDSIQEEPASEDLEEYYKKEFLPNEWFAKSGQRTISQFNFFTAKHFAEWQKRQMTEDAKDAWVNTYESPDGRYYAEFVIDEPPANYRGKKNAKIIIVKVE